ncbi:MAG TPA: sugar phosphate nucleotidyltransferase [Candidatus Saccharimonadales bacterium]|nr:sugar phosphate nucleotidyltransferase [Candidatus Saccharimonadales bacterium]
MKCTTAVIALAGYGTRRLPITKAVEKCMMPVGNRPIVDYVVDDLIAAGITDIIFVVGEQADQIRTYYGHNALLESHLEEQGKSHYSVGLKEISTKARYKFIVQDRYRPYGTTTPLWLAKDLIPEGEPFLMMYGDNIYYNQDGSSSIADYLAQADQAGTKGAMLAVPVPDELVSRYGIVATRERDGHELYDHIVEHPKVGEAPAGNLNNAGCFLLHTDIFPHVERSMKEESDHAEKWLIDAINWWVEAGNDTAVIRLKGEYLDCGSLEGWLYANNRIVNNK